MREVELDLSDLQRMLGAKPASTRPNILPEAVIDRLRQAAKLYARPCDFRVGDWVTPRRDTCLRGAGEPHLVVEVDPDAGRYKHGDWSAISFGARLTIRVLTLGSDTVVPFWSEHWAYERFDLDAYLIHGAAGPKTGEA